MTAARPTVFGGLKAIPNVLSIAGTDPTGGAGMQADIKAISANGGYAMSVVTALVAQNTQGVQAIMDVDPAFITTQLESVASDVRIDAIKIGMLSKVEVIAAVKAFLQSIKKQQPAPVVVLDPVMVASSGDLLLSEDAVDAVKDLIKLADLITPNVPELAVLAGVEEATTVEQARAQAQQVAAEHQVLVLLKGGHLHPDANNQLIDELISPEEVLFSSPTPYVATPNTHGTGCSYSSAVATQYALSGDWVAAVGAAQSWLAQAIASSGLLTVGGGTEKAGPTPDASTVQRSGHGPVHHFSQLNLPR